MIIRYTIVLVALLYNILAFSQTPKSDDYPHYPEWMFKNRVSELNKNSLIRLDYNEQVQAYIDVYTIKRREHLSNIIGRSEMYFPLFEEYLAKYELPMELKYLAIVESALDPKAKSKSGAMGLWQFLYHASRMFDLKVDNFVDERCDPVKSTEAACRYLNYLYQNLNDWQLALAAYNGGIGVVQKAIERSGGKTDFWELQPYLPQAVCSYVPAFIAVNYVMNNYHRHDITPKKPTISFDEVDTVYINKSLSFTQIHKASKVPVDVIEWLNPAYIRNYIPVDNNPVMLFLPKSGIGNFINAEDSLVEELLPVGVSPPVGDKTGREPITHVVKKGEFFHKIAIDNHCRIDDIIYWNNLKSRNLYVNQKLMVWRPVKENRFFFITSEGKSEKLKLHINRLLVDNDIVNDQSDVKLKN